jgi:SAM-dependent methyltransferase
MSDVLAEPTGGWGAWLERWEAQQTRHIPLREERFAVIGDAVEQFAGGSPLILDLGCGPGSLSRRLLDRLPAARAVGVDADPLLLELGRRTLGDMGGRLRLLAADLRDPAWVERLPQSGPYDAVVSTTALHWLTSGELTAVLCAAAGLLRDGGVFVNGDHIMFASGAPRIAAAADGLGSRLAERSAAAGAEDWATWWDAAEREPAFAALAELRREHWRDHPYVDEPGLTVDEWSSLLAEAGFAECAVLWQHLGTSVVAALR